MVLAKNFIQKDMQVCKNVYICKKLKKNMTHSLIKS